MVRIDGSRQSNYKFTGCPFCINGKLPFVPTSSIGAAISPLLGWGPEGVTGTPLPADSGPSSSEESILIRSDKSFTCSLINFLTVSLLMVTVSRILPQGRPACCLTFSWRGNYNHVSIWLKANIALEILYKASSQASCSRLPKASLGLFQGQGVNLSLLFEPVWRSGRLIAANSFSI